MNTPRRYDLDWLRVLAFGLLMLFHTGMMFSTWDWHVKNIQTSDSFDNVMRWLHAWRMPLLFFISGAAVWFVMDRVSARRFLLERQQRLLLPLIFGMLAIIPPQIYFERLYHHQQYDSFLDFYRTVFTSGPYPQGNLSWHHLWYIPYIWAFSMIMLPLFVAIKTTRGRKVLSRALGFAQRPWVLLLLFVPSAVAEIILRPYWPGDANNLFSDWANFTHKLTFFVSGFLMASSTDLSDCISAHRVKFLVAGIIAFAILQPIWLGHWHVSKSMTLSYRMLSNFHIWMWLLAVLGFGRAHLNFNHPLLRQANEAVYPFYILHQTIIIAFAYQLAYVNWSIGVKFLVVASGTFFVCWALYTFAIRPWNVLRVCFGMKWQRPKDREHQAAGAGFAAGLPGRSGLEPGKATSCSSPSSLGGVLLPVTILFVTLGTGCSPQGGKVVCRSIVAPSLSTNLMNISPRQQLAIYLPQSYGQTRQRYPVLYFLPNFKYDLWRYTGATFQGFRFEEAMQRQLRAGAAKEMIIVIPNAVHFLGSSWYRNSPLTGNWEDFIVQDVVNYVDGHFRTLVSPSSRGLAGHGVGGLGALELALKHPDVFGSVYAMSPAVFDQGGVTNLHDAFGQTIHLWEKKLSCWKNQDQRSIQLSFRDGIQSGLNSPSRTLSFQYLLLSYAAAVGPDLRLAYPHFNLPTGPATGDWAPFNNGMGGWEAKLHRYLAGPQKLKSVTLEYGRDDEHEWLRRGSDYVSALMERMGIPNERIIHAGGHDSTLAARLETGLLPSMSRSVEFQK